MNRKRYISLAQDFRRIATEEAGRYLHDCDDVEDIVQEVLLKMWERCDELKDSVPMLRTYVRTLTHNLCIDRLRQRQRHPMLRIDPDADDEGNGIGLHAQTDDTPQRRIEDTEAQTLYLKALDRLPYTWRMILRMRLEEDIPFKEIASVIGTTESSVRGMLCKARMRLFNLINNEMR